MTDIFKDLCFVGKPRVLSLRVENVRTASGLLPKSCSSLASVGRLSVCFGVVRCSREGEPYGIHRFVMSDSPNEFDELLLILFLPTHHLGFRSKPLHTIA
jgi:hypothetical protein